MIQWENHEWEKHPGLGYSVDRCLYLNLLCNELFLLRFYFEWIINIDNNIRKEDRDCMFVNITEKQACSYYPVRYDDFLERYPLFYTKRKIRTLFDHLCGKSGKRAIELVTDDYNPYPLRKKLIYSTLGTVPCFACVPKNIEWLEGEENGKKILEFPKQSHA